jgi:hypothetical protein
LPRLEKPFSIVLAKINNLIGSGRHAREKLATKWDIYIKSEHTKKEEI